jgi:hypothetical protein
MENRNLAVELVAYRFIDWATPALSNRTVLFKNVFLQNIHWSKKYYQL